MSAGLFWVIQETSQDIDMYVRDFTDVLEVCTCRIHIAGGSLAALFDRRLLVISAGGFPWTGTPGWRPSLATSASRSTGAM